MKEAFLALFVSISIIAFVIYSIINACNTHKQTVVLPHTPWYSYNKDDVIIKSKVLSTAKDIILVDRLPDASFRPTNTELTFDNSKSLCASFCGDIYFPSTFEETKELRLILDDIQRTHHIYVTPWLRRIFFK